MFAKKIDGTFVAVEAAAENAYKKLWVATAYFTKKPDALTQVFNAANATPNFTSETSLPSQAPGFGDNIPSNSGNVMYSLEA